MYEIAQKENTVPVVVKGRTNEKRVGCGRWLTLDNIFALW
jgi:hypothetical protein